MVSAAVPLPSWYATNSARCSRSERASWAAKASVRASVKPDAQVLESRCYFTNALMGLKDDAKGCVGPLSGDPDDRQRCLDFLRFQAEVIQPGCVLALGGDAMRALVKLGADVRNAWCGPRGDPRTIKNMLLTPTSNPLPSASLSASVRCAVAVLYHPCELRDLRPVWTEAITLVRSAASHCGNSPAILQAPASTHRLPLPLATAATVSTSSTSTEIAFSSSLAVFL